MQEKTKTRLHHTTVYHPSFSTPQHGICFIRKATCHFPPFFSFSYAYSGDYNELVYLRARYYAPGMGRFLTRDIWEGNKLQPLSYNRWNYTNGNPTNHSDPSGLCSQYNWNDPPGGLFSKEKCDLLESIYLDATKKYPSISGLSTMAEWYDQVANAAEKDGNIQSAQNIRHFLHGNGAPLRLSNEFMMNQLWGWTYIQDKVNELVNWKIQKDCDFTSISDTGYARQVTIFPGGPLGNLYTYWLDP